MISDEEFRRLSLRKEEIKQKFDSLPSFENLTQEEKIEQLFTLAKLLKEAEEIRQKMRAELDRLETEINHENTKREP